MQVLPLPAEQQQAEAVIKKLSVLGYLLLVGTLINGCSSSADSLSDDTDSAYVTETVQSDTAVISPATAAQQKTNVAATVKTTPQRFNVQADTLSAHARKKTNGTAVDIAVRAAPQRYYYSVQIGAFRLKSNADRNYALAQKRFNLPTMRIYEQGIKMERICTGRFSTKKQALAFLKKIQEQFPKEYVDAWIVRVKK